MCECGRGPAVGEGWARSAERTNSLYITAFHFATLPYSHQNYEIDWFFGKIIIRRYYFNWFFFSLFPFAFDWPLLASVINVLYWIFIIIIIIILCMKSFICFHLFFTPMSKKIKYKCLFSFLFELDNFILVWSVIIFYGGHLSHTFDGN